MDFIINYNPESTQEICIQYCTDLSEIVLSENIVYIEKLEHLDYLEIKNESNFTIAIGDVINFKKSNNNFSNCKGLFYLLTMLENNKKLKIESDHHGLLPIYYFEQNKHFFISSSFTQLGLIIQNKSLNKQFYGELAILYTQINRSTYLEGIHRLEYGEYIELDKKIEIIKSHRFYDYFTSTPIPFKKSINEIAQLFISVSKSYLDKPCAISLTGGFDGRTITGCAHYHKSEFINFSYGKTGSGDVDNPKWISQKLKLPYKHLQLDEEYLKNEYSGCVQSYLNYSGGYNGFQYPQSLYFAKEIGKDYSIIVTGYLGSEILANPHSGDDEVTAQSVLDILIHGINDENYAYRNLNKLMDLKLIEDKTIISHILEDLNLYFSNLPNSLTKNQKLAVFSFENIYRNTFGAWIYNGMHYSKIRVPFMDKEFLEKITKTEVSQFYRNFLEKKATKRIQGQLLYATILKLTWPKLNALTSSKGYAPKDMLSLFGKAQIAINKKLKNNRFKEKNDLDKLSTISGALSFIENINKTETRQLIKENIVTSKKTNNTLMRSLCFLALSRLEFGNILNTDYLFTNKK